MKYSISFHLLDKTDNLSHLNFVKSLSSCNACSLVKGKSIPELHDESIHPLNRFPRNSDESPSDAEVNLNKRSTLATSLHNN